MFAMIQNANYYIYWIIYKSISQLLNSDICSIQTRCRYSHSVSTKEFIKNSCENIKISPQHYQNKRVARGTASCTTMHDLTVT